jgi:hypothetical protein
MKDTVAIAFNGGSYGTYLEWCLTTLCEWGPIMAPFTSTGNSHKFTGNHALSIQGWRTYVNSDTCYKFVRLHPKVSQSESLTASLNEIADQARYTIYLYPDQQDILLGVNNFFYKIWNNWISASFKTLIDPDKIYKNWPVAKDTPITQVPTWILREIMSFYLMPVWLDQIEWNHTSRWNHPKAIVVSPRELLFDFSNVLLKIKKYCNLEYVRSIEVLHPYHVKNLELQKYIDHDRICNLIIQAIVNKTNLDWSALSLPSEAWIQWQLRNLGYEIMCNELDIFPTNSVQLRELLYQS